MDIYKFWCRNKDCAEHSGYTHIKLSREELNQDHECLECGGVLKLMGQITNFHAKIGSMTPNERKEILLKRARDHSKTDSYLQQRKKELLEKA